MRVAKSWLVAASVAWALCSGLEVAHADAVPPPPDDCPKGQVGITGHGGPACVPEAPKDCAPGYRGETGGNCVLWLCSSDQECEKGQRCLEVDVCQEYRELHWTGWGWMAQYARNAGNALGGPPAPQPEGAVPKVWVKLSICGQDGPCSAPAECRPTGLCYPPDAAGRTKAKVVGANPQKEELPAGVSPRSLTPVNQRSAHESTRTAESESGAGCRRGCSLATSTEAATWMCVPTLLGLGLWRRRLRSVRRAQSRRT